MPIPDQGITKMAYDGRVTRDRLLDGRLKLRHLTLIAAIADEGSLIATAKALHVTQPAVTRALHEVEQILEVPLFDRGPRGVTPTIFGESFIEHARSVLAQLRQAGGQIDLLTRAEIGRVRVGTHLAGSNILLPRAIASLKAQHPKLIVAVQEATPDLLYDSLLTGRTDLVIGRLRAEPPQQLCQERLYVEPMQLVTRADHPARDFDLPQLSQLLDFPWIMPVEQTSLRSELESLFVAEGLPLPENRVECTSILIVRELLLSTDMIAVLPQLIIRSDKRLAVLQTKLHALSRSVGVTMRSRAPMVPAAQMLLQHLRVAAAALGATNEPNPSTRSQ
ncbi:LysR substrate-binding domain-containing protein [Nocardia sp. R6R-6]|uniref:LysR substrate-binding domain-containing protein n=1 Tax=Nocardia sp. R6R-6 TaxID=3459303 RepID=UPI00403DF94D